MRSIPACAGEAVGGRPTKPGPTVYPRVCGGSCPMAGRWTFRGGLSPRVRGKPLGIAAGVHLQRSIPACAGEAPQGDGISPPGGVYPRVCGGSFVPAPGWLDATGLSPRVRGKPTTAELEFPASGSIPACAGEACRRGTADPIGAVYPRVCGGSPAGRHRLHRKAGLSPRVRGKQPPVRVIPPVPGSIPACAGEAPGHICPLSLPRVYPRVCGGSGGAQRKAGSIRGLSPRVQGKLRR